MTQMGRIIILAGLVIVGIGVVVWLLGRLGFRGLPGDIRYQGDNVKIYFPIVTSLVLSVLLTGLMWLIAYFRSRH